MRDLLVIVPSRGRPASIARLWDAMQATCQGGTDLLVSLDDDDPAHRSYPPGPAYQILAGVRGVVGHLNASADLVSGYRFTGTLGDDNVPRTGGWDTAIMDALGETPFAFANDLYPREPGSHPAHIFCRSGVVKALNYLAVPTLKHMFCVTPDTPVLTADLHWIPAGKVTVGDELVGVDEYSPQPRMTRHFRRATVLGAQRRMADCVRVDLKDGRQVTCSAEHRWLALRHWMGTGQRGGSGRFEWRESAHFRPGDQIVSPLRVWGDETSFEIGWLAGIFDGEGTASRSKLKRDKPYFNTTVSVAQNPDPVLERIEATLGAMGITYRVAGRRTYKGRPGVVILEMTPRSQAVELLGRLQTSRLRPEVIWEDMAMQPRDSSATLAKVERVTPVGAAEVASLETSTGTFLANGLVAHNCDNAWKAWGEACGITYLHDVVIEHLHFTQGKSAHDATYRGAEDAWDGDKAAWEAYQADGLAEDIAKIKAAVSRRTGAANAHL